MMIGSNKGRTAGLKAFQNRGQVSISVVRFPYPRFFEIKPTKIIMVMQRRPPTPKPEINSLPMDTLAIHP